MDNKKWDYTFKWRIENLSSHSYDPNEDLKSSTFMVNSLDGHLCYLTFYPKGENQDKTEYITCYLNLIRKFGFHKKITIDLKISIMNANNDVMESCSKENHDFNGYKVHESLGWDFIRIGKCNEDTLIVECCIKNCQEKELDERIVRTRLSTEKYFLEWYVTVLSNLMLTSEKHFFCLEDNLYRISLCDDANDFEINIYKVTPAVRSSHPISGRITLIDVKGNEVLSKFETHSYDSNRDNNTWKFPLSIKKEQIQENLEVYANDNKILLICEFAICSDPKKKNVRKNNCKSISNNEVEDLIHLRQSFETFLSNKSNTDVKLKACDGEELHCHRSILTARSPVFSAMFSQDMIENKTGTISIDDVDSQTLDSFLKFLYTGVFEFSDWEQATEALLVADKYQVSNLKDRCGSALSSLLSTNNVCQILVLADSVQHKILKAVSLEFAAKHATEIFSSPECSEWITNHPQLCAEVLAHPKNCESHDKLQDFRMKNVTN